MKILITENEKGKYQNKQGKRFNLLACTWVKGLRANEFETFKNLDEALKKYGLTEVKDEDKITHPVIFFKMQESPAGKFQDETGNRYDILTCAGNCAGEGWTSFESIEEACAAWNLAPADEE